MIAKKIKVSNKFVAFVIISMLLFGFLVGLVGEVGFECVNDKNTVYNEYETRLENVPIEKQVEKDSIPIDGSRAGIGGTLKWSIQLANEEISTPVICDLDPSQDRNKLSDKEIVIASADDKICAVDKTGKLIWEFNDCVIDNAEIFSQYYTEVDIPPFFSSPVAIDLNIEKGDEIFIGEQDGVLCLNSSGRVIWKDKGTTDGYYFSIVAICDLEGDYLGIDFDGNYVGYQDDLEILLGSTNEDINDGFVECWGVNSKEVFRFEISNYSEFFTTNGFVTAELDGHFLRSQEHLNCVRENNPETLFTDLLIGTCGYPGRIYKHNETGPEYDYYEAARIPADHWGNYNTHSTAVVSNFTGGPELECIIGHGSNSSSWTTSTGTVRMYRQDGTEVCTPFTTGSAPSAVFSSPAACDAQNIDYRDLDNDEIIDYEVYFGCDNGIFYCLNARDLTELWQYKTGGRVLSSPAVCNIDSDDSLEVVIGSNDGKVYCFEADPQELDDKGNPNPKDDGIEDDGGDSGKYDLLWVFDTNKVAGSSGEIGISSPVIGDIDLDGQLEVIIGDNGGMLYCINAGGKCIPGSVDWPKLHYDLNNTGFYNPSNAYGVKIEPQGYNDNLTETVRPGQSVTYNFTIKNIGDIRTSNRKDMFWLEVEQSVYNYKTLMLNHEWPKPKFTGKDLFWGYENGKSELKPFLILECGQFENISLMVTAPWTCDLDEMCVIELKVHSDNDSFARDFITTKTMVNVTLDFDVDIQLEIQKSKESELYGEKVLEMCPGGTDTLEVKVKNLGDINDSYDLSISGHQFIPDWDAMFTDINSDHYQAALKLDAELMKGPFNSTYNGSEGLVKFTIKAPLDVEDGEMLVLRVIGKSRYTPKPDEGFIQNYFENITKEDKMIVVIKSYTKFELICDKPFSYINPGDDVYFNLELVNYGDSKISVLLEHHEIIDHWILKYYDKHDRLLTKFPTIEINREDVILVQVYIEAPQSATAGIELKVKIKGTATNNNQIKSFDSVNLTVIVNQYFNITSETILDMLELDPGSSGDLYIFIQNHGNGPDFVEISKSFIPVDWNLEFYIAEEICNSTDLERNSSALIKIRVWIPFDQLAGKYRLLINISNIDGFEILEFNIHVKKIDNLSLFGIDHDAIDESGVSAISGVSERKILTDLLEPKPGVAPGSILNFVFELTNHGNAEDLIRLSLVPMEIMDKGIENNTSKSSSWNLFNALGWKTKFMTITNTIASCYGLCDHDFSNKIDMTQLNSPNLSFGYFNNDTAFQNEILLKLGVGQTVWIHLQLFVPENIPEIQVNQHYENNDIWFFKLICDSYQTEACKNELFLSDNEVDLKLLILRPDLEIIGEINKPDRIPIGKQFNLSVNIRNTGDIIAQNVKVTLFVYKIEINSSLINKLEPNETIIITYYLEIPDGEYKILIMVDPENSITESNENNNEKATTIHADANKLKSAIEETQLNAFLIVVLIIIIFAFLLYFFKKKY